MGLRSLFSKMSRSHVRVPPPPVKQNHWMEAAIFAVAIVLGGFYVYRHLWPDPVDQNHETAAGKVLETRLVVVGKQDTSYGGSILYRIDAHVSYPLHGQPQDRWMPASDITGDRAYLALQMAKQSGKCTVYWAPHHEDNPRCLLQ